MDRTTRHVVPPNKATVIKIMRNTDFFLPSCPKFLMLGAWAGIGIAARSTWSESPMHPSDPKRYSKCHLTLPANPDKTWRQDEIRSEADRNN